MVWSRVIDHHHHIITPTTGSQHQCPAQMPHASPNHHIKPVWPHPPQLSSHRSIYPSTRTRTPRDSSPKPSEKGWRTASQRLQFVAGSRSLRWPRPSSLSHTLTRDLLCSPLTLASSKHTCSTGGFFAHVVVGVTAFHKPCHYQQSGLHDHLVITMATHSGKPHENKYLTGRPPFLMKEYLACFRWTFNSFGLAALFSSHGQVNCFLFLLSVHASFLLTSKQTPSAQHS